MGGRGSQGRRRCPLMDLIILMIGVLWVIFFFAVLKAKG